MLSSVATNSETMKITLTILVVMCLASVCLADCILHNNPLNPFDDDWTEEELKAWQETPRTYYPDDGKVFIGPFDEGYVPPPASG